MYRYNKHYQAALEAAQKRDLKAFRRHFASFLEEAEVDKALIGYYEATIEASIGISKVAGKRPGEIVKLTPAVTKQVEESLEKIKKFYNSMEAPDDVKNAYKVMALAWNGIMFKLPAVEPVDRASLRAKYEGMIDNAAMVVLKDLSKKLPKALPQETRDNYPVIFSALDSENVPELMKTIRAKTRAGVIAFLNVLGAGMYKTMGGLSEVSQKFPLTQKIVAGHPVLMYIAIVLPLVALLNSEAVIFLSDIEL